MTRRPSFGSCFSPTGLFAPAILGLVLMGSGASARESFGIFGSWATFRDPEIPRCYAISKTKQKPGPLGAAIIESAVTPGYVTIGTWPERRIRNQFHARLSRPATKDDTVQLRVGSRKFTLTSNGHDAWARDARENSAIIAALRSARSMTVVFAVSGKNQMADRYDLEGAATAIDAALLACTGGKTG